MNRFGLEQRALRKMTRMDSLPVQPLPSTRAVTPASTPKTPSHASAAAALEPWALARRIKAWALELGFDGVGIADPDLSTAEPGLVAWLAAGHHGEMEYMARHGLKRARPAELVPGTASVVSVRMPYLPQSAFTASEVAAEAPDAGPATEAPHAAAEHWRAREMNRLDDVRAAGVSVYARGRDYHKVMRQRLQTLAKRIEAEIGPFGHRVFCDSAPLLEVELARRAGLGWRGKHTLLLHPDAGSFFFLGELLLDLRLPPDALATAKATAIPAVDGAHCGQCRRCIDACPTGAIIAPYRLDARRCISYLTIEHRGSIPEALRPALGNRIYGCDDCQLVCPWNKFARVTPVPDFETRNGLDHASLLELFAWDETQFEARLAGSAIRRIGHRQWLRNLAVALGNARRALSGPQRVPFDAALAARADDPSELVREHVAWALRQE